MKNPWRSIQSNPPPEYTRVEIKDINRKHYIGYRYRKTYYETYGNWVIQNPEFWRWIPATSTLLAELKEKISMNNSKVEVMPNE